MFGFSLAELILVLIVAVIFVKPQDLPEIAAWIAKNVIKFRHYFAEFKRELTKIGDEMGVKEIREEVNQAILSQKIALEDENEKTTIVDIYGNEHKVESIEKLRTDLTKEQIEEEVTKHNQHNKKNNQREEIS